jgi:hypothetical protein
MLIGYEYKILWNPNYMQQGIYAICCHLFILLRMRSWTRPRSNPRLPSSTHNQNNQTSNTIRTNDFYYYYSGWLLASAGSCEGVTVHGRLLAWTLDCGGGGPGVCVGCVEATGLTIYHPLVPSDGGVSVLQPDMERLDLSLSSQ